MDTHAAQARKDQPPLGRDRKRGGLSVAIRWHEDDPALLLEAIRFSSAEIGFIPRLIEKDYFCSVLLQYLSAGNLELTFKGGTCLSKIHGGFYRLSEDLDFSISTSIEATRAQRSKSVDGFKAAVSAISGKLRAFQVIEAPAGANNSTQYNAIVGYKSLLDDHLEPVSIEVGVREPTLTQGLKGPAKTALLNPITGRALVEAFDVLSLSYIEAMAEKLRAALTRREVAIRDFFDVDHAVRNGLNTRDPALLDLLRRKLAIPGTGPVEVSPDRMASLQRQLEAQLRPVLREQEFEDFDLERAIATVREFAKGLA